MASPTLNDFPLKIHPFSLIDEKNGLESTSESERFAIDLVSSFCFSDETVKLTNSTCCSSCGFTWTGLVFGTSVEVKDSTFSTNSLSVVRSLSYSVGNTNLSKYVGVVGADCVVDCVVFSASVEEASVDDTSLDALGDVSSFVVNSVGGDSVKTSRESNVSSVDRSGRPKGATGIAGISDVDSG